MIPTGTTVHPPFSWINVARCLFLALLCGTPSFAGDFTGQVVSVLDGDTIEVLHNQHTERIRFNGIDCPEKGQAYGLRRRTQSPT